MCLSHLIYTARSCLIHTCHAAPMPCSDHAVLLKATAWSAWHGRGMASVNQTRPHFVNQMGKTNSKHLAARHGRGTVWDRHGHGMLCVNRPLLAQSRFSPAVGLLPLTSGPVCFGTALPSLLMKIYIGVTWSSLPRL